jgi:hypothetical protein
MSKGGIACTEHEDSCRCIEKASTYLYAVALASHCFPRGNNRASPEGQPYPGRHARRCGEEVVILVHVSKDGIRLPNGQLKVGDGGLLRAV